MLDLIIVGGGIAGLSAAFYAKRAGLTYQIWEASSQVGGLIQSHNISGNNIELGPNSIRPGLYLNEIIDELGLEPIHSALPQSASRIFHGDKALRMLNILSLSDYWGLVKEFLRLFPDRPNHEETVEEFFMRHFGEGIVDKLIAAIISGIYAGDPSQLSINEVFPGLTELEDNQKSILQTILAGRKQAQAPMINFDRGLSELIDDLADYIGRENIRIGYPAYSLNQMPAKNAIIATPAHKTAELLPSCEELLKQIKYSSVLTMTASIPSERLRNKHAKTLGFLSNRYSELRALGMFHNSSIFPELSTKDELLITGFYGGVNDMEIFANTEDDLIEIFTEDIEIALNTEIEPNILAINSWKESIPQYKTGHRDLIKQITQKLPPNIKLAGSYLYGIGIEDIVKSSHYAVESLMQTTNIQA